MSFIDDVIRREGREFTNDPNDRGGPTKFGITKRDLEAWLGRPVSVDEVKNLDEATARTIFETKYYKRPGFDKIPWKPLAEQLADWGIHSGPTLAIMNLQEILGVERDGVLGPKTLKALSEADSVRVNISVAKRRLMMFTRIVRKDPTQLKFLSGWVSRALEFI
jgi:lysozyme family protein